MVGWSLLNTVDVIINAFNNISPLVYSMLPILFLIIATWLEERSLNKIILPVFLSGFGISERYTVPLTPLIVNPEDLIL